MSLGVVILVLGLLYLLIVSPRFRRFTGIILAFLAVAVLLVVWWYRRNEANRRHKQEIAKTYIKPNQIELVDPRVSFSTYDGRPERLTARIRNNS
jgi:4-amino-4-deoxy-L-arabinose transferase-like glycosyltransferase